MVKGTIIMDDPEFKEGTDVFLADVESERLVNIFTEITRRRNLQ